MNMKDNWEKCIKDADLVMASAKKLLMKAQEYNDNDPCTQWC